MHVCRGQAIALATLTNFGSNFAVSLVLPSLQENFGQAGARSTAWGGAVQAGAGWCLAHDLKCAVVNTSTSADRHKRP